MRVFLTLEISLDVAIDPSTVTSDASVLFLFDEDAGQLHHPSYDIHHINEKQAVLALPTVFTEATISIEGKGQVNFTNGYGPLCLEINVITGFFQISHFKIANF